MFPHVHCSTIYIAARTWKQPRYPSKDEWIWKIWYIYSMEYYSAIKRNTLEFVLMMWMNLEPIIKGEVSLKEEDKYHIQSIYKESRNIVLKNLRTGQQ